MQRMQTADELFFLAHDLVGAGHWAEMVDVQMSKFHLERESDPFD